MRIYTIFFVLRAICAPSDGIGEKLLVTQRLRHGFQGYIQYLINPLHGPNVEMLFDIVRHFFQVTLIFLGDNNRLYPSATRRQ